MFDIKSRPNILLIMVLATVAIVSAGFAFQIMGLSDIAFCLFSTSILLLILVSYLGRIIMVNEPPPKQPFSKSSLDTAILSLNVLWRELIVSFIFFIILKLINFSLFIINYVFALLFFTVIATEAFTIFAYTKGYTRLKPTTKNIPIVLTVANLIIIILSLLAGFNIFLSSSEWGFIFSFSIFITIPYVARYLEMPKNKEILAGVSKEEVFKGKAIIYLAVSLILPFIIFPVCYFIIPPLKLPYIKWWYIAIVLLPISELYPIILIHRQLKKVKKMMVVRVRSFENVIRISIIISSVFLGILFAVLYAQSSMTKTGVAFESGNITFLSFSILFFTGPPSFYEYFRFKKIDRMEEKFPDFLRDLAEYWKGGLSMSSAVGTLAKGEYAALTGEVKKMATQVSWGVAFHEVLRMFSSRIKSSLVNRSVALIEEADKAGGRISDVLATASNDAREIKWLQLERKRNTSSYVMIVYVSFFVYLGIVGVMAGLFIPAIVSSTEGLSGGGGMGGVSMGSINVSLTVFLFFCSALIQGIGNGIVGGLLGDGKIVSGLRHGFIMVLITLVVFAGVIYPIAVDLAQPSSSVEPISYWQTSSFDITVSASDKMPGSGMDSVELFYRYSEDNYTWSDWMSYSAPDEEAPWEFKFSPTGDGYYEFYSIATDIAGNTEGRPARADMKCGVDSTAPKTTINEISPYWQTENIIFTASVFDRFTGINSTTLHYMYKPNNDTGFGSWISLGTYNVSDISSPRHSSTHQWNFNWTNGEGIYRFKAEGIDCIRNPEHKDFDMELGYDLTPPSSTVTAIPSYWQSEEFNVPYTASDNVDLKSIELYYRYRVDNTSSWNPWYGYATENVRGTIVSGNFSFKSLRGEGIYEFYTVATDSSGRKEVKSVYEEEVGHDKTSPASAVEPVFTYWHNETITVTAQLSESLSGVKDVSLYYYNSTDNNTWTGPFSFGVCYSSPWEWNFDFPNGTGYYQFYSVSTDNAGNTEELPPLADTLCAYDNITPESNVVPVGYWQNISTFVITASASDNISGVSSVELYYNYSADNSTWNGWVPFGSGDYNSTNKLWEWNFTTPEGDGYYMFYSVATDNATNTESSPDTYDIICAVDTTPPEITINDISNYLNSLDAITGTASDTLSGVNKTQIRIYNVTGGTNWTGSGWSAAEVWVNAVGYETWTYNTAWVTWMDNCSYTIYANSTDNATNVGSTVSDSFGFDTTPPDTTINDISDYVNVLDSITGTASDGFSGVNKTRIRIYNITGGTNWTGSVWDSGEYWLSASGYNFWNYDSSGVAWMDNCSYTIYANSTDNATNVDATPASDSFGYDITQPELEILTPLNNANLTSPVIWFNGTCSDSLSGIKTVEINITNNATGEVVVSWTAVNFTSAEWNYSHSFTTDGNYTVTVKAVDNASNNQTATINISYSSAKKYFSGLASSHKTIVLFTVKTKVETYLRERI